MEIFQKLDKGMSAFSESDWPITFLLYFSALFFAIHVNAPEGGGRLTTIHLMISVFVFSVGISFGFFIGDAVMQWHIPESAFFINNERSIKLNNKQK